MTPLAPHMTYFLRERLPRERRASVHTCETYAHAFRLLVEFAAIRLKTAPSQLSLEQIDAPLVLDFLEYLETQRGNGGASRNARLAAIKSFMHFVEFRVTSALDQVRQILAIPSKKTDTRLVRHLTMAEVQAIIDAPDPKTRIGIRDRAMLHTCFVGGLRASELVGLKVEDVSFDPRPCIRVLGKGRRERLLPLWKESGTVLRQWLAIRGPATVPELFLNARGDAMTRAGFEYLLRQHVQTAIQACPALAQETDLASWTSAFLRHDDPRGDRRYPEGGPMARPQQLADHRNVPPRRSDAEARGDQPHDTAFLAQGKVHCARSSHRTAAGHQRDPRLCGAIQRRTPMGRTSPTPYFA